MYACTTKNWGFQNRAYFKGFKVEGKIAGKKNRGVVGAEGWTVFLQLAIKYVTLEGVRGPTRFDTFSQYLAFHTVIIFFTKLGVIHGVKRIRYIEKDILGNIC